MESSVSQARNPTMSQAVSTELIAKIPDYLINYGTGCLTTLPTVC